MRARRRVMMRRWVCTSNEENTVLPIVERMSQAPGITAVEKEGLNYKTITNCFVTY